MDGNAPRRSRQHLWPPRPPTTLLARPRLTTQLSETPVRVTTIVAPAGYGKSSLAAEWGETAHARMRRFAYVALEPEQDDAMLFWTTVLGAIEELGAATDDGLGSLLRAELRQAPNRHPRTFLLALLTALEDAPQRGILLLDDIHVVQTPAIREGLAYFANRLPPTVHLVLTSRSPITDMSLHRLLTRDELHELTVDDLAFTVNEGNAFLASVTNLALEPQVADDLVHRTEGWITGLKLAAAALRDAGDPQAYVRMFAGRNRNVADFLVREVLDRQPDDLRRFLLDTSILRTLTAGICDAVTGREDSAVQLRRLETGGIFFVALDDRRDAFRYHTLFADFLRSELVAADPRRARDLHEAASTWFERVGETSTAIDHALAATEYERAADLLAAVVADHHRRGLDGTLRSWFSALPEELIAQRPELAVKRGWIQSYAGAPLETLRWCERADQSAGDRDDVLVESSCLRAHTYRMLGDLDATIEWGVRARELLDQRNNHARHLDAYPSLAMTDAVAEAHGLLGRPLTAIGLLHEGLERARAGGNDFAAVSLPGQLAALSSLMGRLDEAAAFGERSLQTAERLGLLEQPPSAEALVAVGEVLWERNDLRSAEQHFIAAVEATTRSQRTWIRARALMGMARCRVSQRSGDEALAILDTVEKLHRWGATPKFLMAQIAERQVRFRCATGDAAGARDWMLRLRSEWVMATTPVVLLEALVQRVEGEPGEALRTLASVSDDDPVDRTAIGALERLVAVAVSANAAGDRAAALTALAQSVRIGESQRFVRSIIEPAAALLAGATRLLKAGVGNGPAPSAEYLQELDRAARAEQGHMSAALGRVSHTSLREPLSEAELAVIRFLPQDCTYAEIASSRYVSVNTVKSQLKSIYRKLDVATRVSAVERSRALGLLSD